MFWYSQQKMKTPIPSMSNVWWYVYFRMQMQFIPTSLHIHLLEQDLNEIKEQSQQHFLLELQMFTVWSTVLHTTYKNTGQNIRMGSSQTKGIILYSITSVHTCRGFCCYFCNRSFFRSLGLDFLILQWEWTVAGLDQTYVPSDLFKFHSIKGLHGKVLVM